MFPTFTAGENGAILFAFEVRNCGAWAATSAGASATAAAAINRRMLFSLQEFVQQRMKVMNSDFAQRRVSPSVVRPRFQILLHLHADLDILILYFVTKCY